MTAAGAGRNIVLIGMMGAGKTTIGRLLAARLDRPFVDTDEVVEAEQGQTVAELFAGRGEAYFRSVEAAVVRRVAAVGGQVVAVGGGAVLEPGNVTALQATGDLVYLDAPPAVLAANLDASGQQAIRPLLAGSVAAERLTRLSEDRQDAYRGAATHVVAAGSGSPESLVGKILAWARRQPGLLTPAESS